MKKRPYSNERRAAAADEGLIQATLAKYPPKVPSIQKQRKRQAWEDKDAVENDLVDNIDLKYQMIETFKTIIPHFQKHLESGDVTKLLHGAAPFAVMTLISEMLSADKPRERIDAAKTVSYMAGYQPVQRNLNIEGNIDRMTDDQVTGLLKAAFHGMSADEKKTIQAALEQGQLMAPKGSKDE